MDEWSKGLQTIKMILVMFSAVSLVYVSSFGCGRGEQDEIVGIANRSFGGKVIDIEAASVETMDIRYDIYAVGSFLSNEDVTVTSEVTGKVKEIFADEGSPVKKGGILLKLDDEKARLAVEKARSVVEEARAAFDKLMAGTRAERVEQMKTNLDKTRISLEKIEGDYKKQKESYESGLIDKGTFDKIESGYETAKKKALTAEDGYRIAISGPAKEDVGVAKAKIEKAMVGLKVAEKNLKDTSVYSPITGIVNNRMVSLGEHIKNGTKLFKIVQNDPLKLSFSIPEVFAGEVKIGQTLVATVNVFPGEKFTGKVYFISPESDPSTRSLKVKAKIGNRDNRLKQGFSADIQLTTSTKKDAMVLPEEAVVSVANKPSIFIVRNNRVILDHIRVGRRLDRKVEVLSHRLKRDDMIVTKGHKNLVDNANVRIIGREGG
ncbi:MAG: efflux RND transporter periplasmic adaptor subunit [Deltaproteobacteria bacterium]|nr:MAG: efflux RND transporter periplasmic adaptor subunit [Deltaproteobacteria bacterium]